MKRYLLFLMIVFLASCKNLPKTKKYTVIVETESKAIIGGGTDSHDMNFDIIAGDDNEAYRKGADYYKVTVDMYNQNEDNKYAPRPVDFKVQNELGLDIVPSLLGNIKDSINKIAFAELINDSIRVVNGMPVANKMKNPYLDTVGDGESPVKITSARFVEKDYSSYKDVRLSYKNVSGKRIDAIRFRWFGTNAFGEPADAGSYAEKGVGGGFDDHGLGVGESDYGVWSILSKDGKKIKRAWVTEVAFHDGTKWEHK